MSRGLDQRIEHLQQQIMAEETSTEHLASVIIPNYNHAQYVGEAIQSVLDQIYRDFEIIVVDDGSTDDSREIIGQFGDQIIAIWQENQGLSAARNTGIRAARGAYIALLDADDMYEPDFLSTMVSLLAADPTAAGVYCGYRFVDHLNHPLPQIEARLIPDGQLYESLLDGNFLVPESMLVRRACYEEAGPFDETLTALEDWDMWLRLANQNKIIGTDRVLTRHRILPGSMSSDPTRMLDNRLAVLTKHFSTESTAERVDLDPKKQAYGRAYLVSSVEYLQYGDKERAFTCFHKMAEARPELLGELETFYQLGLGNQPKGSLGDFASLDLQGNSQTLLGMLDCMFGSPTSTTEMSEFRDVAYANAYFVLALQSYGARQFGETRRYLLSALKADPRIASSGRFLAICIKALLPVSLIDQLKVGHQKMATK